MKRLTKAAITQGVAFGIVSALFVTAYMTTNKYIYAHYDSSAIDYTLIFAMAGGLFASVSFARQVDRSNLQLLKANYKSLLVLSTIGALAVGVFVFAQQYTTAVNASLLMTSTIVTTGLFSQLLLRERHNRIEYLWMLILFVGLYIGVVGFRSLHLMSGDMIVIGSALLFGFGNAYSRTVMKRMGGARLVPDVRLAVGGILAFVVSLFVIRNLALVIDLLPLALLGGLFYWLCMKTFAKTVYLINANNAIVLNNGQIFFTSIAGVLILSEHYSIEKFIGSIIAITAIYFIAGRK